MTINRRQFNRAFFGSTILGASYSATGFDFGRGAAQDANSDEAGLSMSEFIRGIPKAESHVHIPGCVTPELLLKLAERNGIEMPYDAPIDVENFIGNSYGASLESFIIVLDQIASVLVTSEDYYHTTYDYLARSAIQNVRYVEASFGPQFALENDLPVVEQLDGMNRALIDARQEYDIDAKWIMSFRRDRPVEQAADILGQENWREHNVVGVGLSELDTPDYPQRFKRVFDAAHQQGLMRTTHVDVSENDATERVWSAVTDLKVDGRIDHGIDALGDPRFVEHLRETGMTLAVCPTLFFKKTPDDSWYFQTVCDAVRIMLDNDLRVTLNTDDPGIFSLNYLADTYRLAQQHLGLSKDEIVQLAKNSFGVLWIDQERKDGYLGDVDEFTAV